MKDLKLKWRDRVERELKSLFGDKRWDGVWLAGGAARAYVLNRPYRDLDFMFSDPVVCEQFTQHAYACGAVLLHERDNLVEVRIRHTVIQICKYGWFKTPQEAIDDFDFTCCKFALDQDLNATYSKEDYNDAVNMVLRLNKPKYPLILCRRIEKYMSEGYTPHGKEFWTELATAFKQLDDKSVTR